MIISTPKQRTIWARMKAENHPYYQQIIFNTTWDRYADQGRWELLRGLIDQDPIWMKKSFDELKASLGGFSTIYYGNEAREMTIDIAMMYDELKPFISVQDALDLKGWLIKVADGIIGKEGNPNGTRFGDSDQCTGSYFGLALIDKVLGTSYLSGTLNNTGQGVDPTWGFGTPPVGGLDATGPNYLTMRNVINRFCTILAKGGYWIEAAGGYNEGTVGLLSSGASYVGMEHFPDVQAFLKENAKYLMHYATPDLKDFFEEGDVEHAHDTHMQLFYPLGDLLSLLQAVIDDPEIAARVRQFEEDINAANNYTPAPLFARYFFHANPYGDKLPWKEWAGDFFIAEGQGHVFWRAGAKATHIHFPSNMEVDHSQAYAHGDMMVRKGDKFLVDRTLGYAAEQRYANTVLVGANVGPGYQAGNGLVGTGYEKGKIAYAVGGWAGLSQINWRGSYGNFPTFNHGTLRHLFELLDGPETVQVVIDVIHAESIQDQILTNQWGTFTWTQYYQPYQQELIKLVPEGKLWIWHGPVQPTVEGGKISWPDLKVEQVYPLGPKIEIIDEKTVTMGGYIYNEAKQWAARITQPEKKDFQVVITGLSDSSAVTYEKVEFGDLIGVTVKRPGLENVTLLVSNKIGPKLETTYDASGVHALFDEDKLAKVVAARKVVDLPVIDVEGTIYVSDVAGSSGERVGYLVKLSGEGSPAPVPVPVPEPSPIPGFETLCQDVKDIKALLEKVFK